MIFKKIHLTNFKNYENQSFDFNDKFNLVVGKNGMGKTNLLDAIYYMALCKSNFQRQDKYVVRYDAEFIRIVSELSEYSLIAKVVPGKQKIFEKDKKAYEKLSEHIGEIPIIFITPADIDDIITGSEERRKLFDQCICQFDKQFVYATMAYSRVIKQRNAYLKLCIEGKKFELPNLKAWDKTLIESGNYIHKKRKDFLSIVNPIFQKMYGLISNEQEDVACSYLSDLNEYSFDILLDRSLEKDRYSGRTNTGIHKDDFEIKMNEKLARRFASQGQLKSLVISLKMALYMVLMDKKESKPILLLDDIFDKLDSTRVMNLLKLVSDEKFGQTFISDTEEKRIADILQSMNHSYTLHVIENGSLKKNEDQ